MKKLTKRDLIRRKKIIKFSLQFLKSLRKDYMPITESTKLIINKIKQGSI
jgi:hypothetical protein